MKRQICLVGFILILFLPAFSQDNTLDNVEKLKKGAEIVKNARKAIGTQEIKIDKFQLKLKTSYVTDIKTSSGISLPDYVTEIIVSMPDKFQKIWAIEKPFPSKTTSIWNGKQYKKIFESELLGKRDVKVTKSSLEDEKIRTAFENKIGKEKMKAFKAVSELDPKDVFFDSIWTDFFPLTLTNPFENDLEFKYVGRAKSADRFANVVDITSKNGKTYRLLFDAETNYLLLMITKYKTIKGEFEAKHYFSNHKLIDNISIPTTIKIENKLIKMAEGSENSDLNFYLTADVLSFTLNPKFNDNIFDAN